jgi:hypothetical protein
MKKLLTTTGKALGFFVLWAIFVSMDFLYEPQFTHGNSAVTRLWWELVPLMVTVIATLIFEKGRVHKCCSFGYEYYYDNNCCSDDI